MADLIRLTSGLKTLSGAGPFLQAITEVVDVSMVDQIDLRFYLHTLTGGGTVTFELLTAMDAKSDADWESMGSVTLPGSGSAPTFKSTTFPQPVLATMTEVPVPLLNYIRWRVSFAGGASAATIQILGFVRRKAL